MTDLKPCPFCGEAAKLEISVHGQTHIGCSRQHFLINCQSRDHEHAVETWNRRPLEETLEAQVKELEAESAKAHAVICYSDDNYQSNQSAVMSLRTQLAQARAAAVQWVTYDGTPEMLPDQGSWVMVILAGHTEPVAALCLLHIDADRSMYWASTDKDWAVSRGDSWTYLPKPMENQL